MKKTKLMRAALLLLVLTLITSCFVGGTFAKYVTEGNSTDSARVAKWGVTVKATGKTFAYEYTTDDQNAPTDMSKSVVSGTKDMVVAPGTSGSMAAVKLSGIPEVAFNVSYTATFDVSGWKIAGTGATSEFYCPLVITVGTTEATTEVTTEGKTEEEFEKAVTDAIASYSRSFVANTDLAKQGKYSLAVSWSWPFSTTDGNNAKDTALGDLAAKAEAGNAPTVTLAVKTTVTQID